MAEAVEGRTRLVAAPSGTAGPGTRDRDTPFYNPAMRRNRDLSLLLLRHAVAHRGRELDVADALCGAGARSLRFAHEVDGPLVVHANDGDPKAVEAVQAAARANDIPADRLRVRHGNAFTFLSERRFDVVDIDPFGSPAPFLDAAVRATRHDGFVCLTATDTAALCGTYPRVARRRYAAHHAMHATPWRAEVGLRVLAVNAVAAAGRHDREARPVWSVFGGHWMRVVLRVRDGRSAADRALREVGHAAVVDGWPQFVSAPPEATRWAGPLWTGALHDADVLEGMAEAVDDAVDARTIRLLDVLRQEADAPAWWVEPRLLRDWFGVDAPRRQRFVDALRGAGFAAAPTHLDPAGVRTDAPRDALHEVLSTAPS